jgi:hypothetical protein
MDNKTRGEYWARLSAMTDDELSKETELKIWLSAYANNNPRSAYHSHADMCYDQWKARGNATGYQAAFDAAKTSCQ